jgi:hypothetical protein
MTNGLPDDHGLDRCLRCGYSLDVTTTTCPECGAARPTDSEIMDARRRAVAARYSRPLFLLAILGPAIFALAGAFSPVVRGGSRELVDIGVLLGGIFSPLAAIAAVLQDSSRRNWIALGLNVLMWTVLLLLPKVAR